MTRTPRDENGKPIPRAIVEDGVPEWADEDTKRIPVPTTEELEAELFQHGGGAFHWDRDRRPL